MIEFGDFSDFILSQNDDRKINMNESVYNGEVKLLCGCVMIHYALKLNLKNVRCGVSSIHHDLIPGYLLLDDESTDFIKRCIQNGVKTYKEAKKLINMF